MADTAPSITEISVTVDNATATWKWDGNGRILGGAVSGNEELCFTIEYMWLCRTEPVKTGSHSSYRFTPAKDQLGDIAATMLAACCDRGWLSQSGWEAIDAVTRQAELERQSTP